jgi:hypothetical protein
MDHQSLPAPPVPGGLAADLNAPVLSPLLRAAPWIALGVSLAILAGYCLTGVQLFADGGFFAFAFLTGDPWGAHFANIPARATAFLVTIVPPYLMARVADPAAAIRLYGLIFGLLPLAGLAATWAIAGNRRILLFCALSTIVILPASVFFPSETLVTHALFWPLFAFLCVSRAPAALPTLLLMLALAFSHEGGMGLLVLLVVFLAAGGRAGRVVIGAGLAVLLAWVAVKILVQPVHGATRDILFDNMLGVVNPVGIIRPLSVAILAGVASAWWLLRREAAEAPPLPRLLAVVGLALIPSAAILIAADLAFVGRHDNLLVGRYNFRTLLLGSLALFLVVLTVLSLPEERRPAPVRRLVAWVTVRARRAPALIFATMLVATACHTMDGVNFLASWRAYAQEVRTIALGRAAPLPAYAEVLSRDVRGAPERLQRPGRAWSMSWDWTDPFLSVVLALPEPAQALVYRPAETYAPLSCARMRAADRTAIRLPAESYALLVRTICEQEGRRR